MKIEIQAKRCPIFKGFILVLLLSICSCSKQETLVNSIPETFLTVEAGVVSGNGDVKPVARTDLYLLDKNFETILQETKFNSELPEGLKERFSKRNLLRAFAVTVTAVQGNSFNDPTFRSEKEASAKSLIKTLNAIKSHTIYETTTDFQGKAQFRNIKPGEYYLLSFSELNSVSIWNLKTTIKTGQNSIILDQKNAAPIY